MRVRESFRVALFIWWNDYWVIHLALFLVVPSAVCCLFPFVSISHSTLIYSLFWFQTEKCCVSIICVTGCNNIVGPTKKSPALLMMFHSPAIMNGCWKPRRISTWRGLSIGLYGRHVLTEGQVTPPDATKGFWIEKKQIINNIRLDWNDMPMAKSLYAITNVGSKRMHMRIVNFCRPL